MGLRVEGTRDLAIKLERDAEKSSRALRRLQQQAAEQIEQTAKQMAPVDTGNLESAVTRATDYNKVVREDYVFVDESQAPYAIYMHESVYELGPKSAQKQANYPFPVGRKFLDRAVEYVMQTMGYFEKARDAVERNLK